MAFLRVIVVERLASFPDLLDHAVRVVLLDEPLYPGVVVAGNDHKAVTVLEDLAVLVGAELDGLETSLTVALAVEPQRRGDIVPLAPLFDLFVDTAKHLLVPGGSLCEVHEAFYHRPAARPAVVTAPLPHVASACRRGPSPERWRRRNLQLYVCLT